MVRAGKKCGHIFGSVDIEHQPAETQYLRVNTFRARLIQMGATTAGTEAALDYVRRGARQRICSGTVGGGHNNQFCLRVSLQARASGGSEAGEIAGRDERNVDLDP